MARMTKESLKDICKENGLYRTPSLNDKLYANFKGYSAIENLEEYTALKALFLEGNVIETIEGLPPLKELRCLYMQQNCLWRISGLEELEALDTLNVSNNQITKLENLSCCKQLKTLIATNNSLGSLDSVAHLAECLSLVTIDIQNNNITDPGIVEVLKQIPDLRCVYLKGNPVVSSMKNYRKTMICAIPSLTYLDDRPVFEDERKCAEAWAVGGLDAEREMRKKIKEEEEARQRENHEFMQQLRAQGWRERRKRMGLPDGDTDPALDGMDSDEEYQFDEDPAELVEARKRLAQYTARQGEEEPQEIAAARQARVADGKPVSQGTWASDAAAAGGVAMDAEIYLSSVKAAQRDLDAVSVRDDDDAAATTTTGRAAADVTTLSSPSTSSLPSPSSTNEAGSKVSDLPDLEPIPIIRAKGEQQQAVALDEAACASHPVACDDDLNELD